MYEENYIRPLGMEEYLHWCENCLPFGWIIIKAPDEDEEKERSKGNESV